MTARIWAANRCIDVNMVSTDSPSDADRPVDLSRAQSPIEVYLERIHKELLPLRDGAVADYIPELSFADPDSFGICIATVDGKIYRAGQTDIPYTIQSMSKPFAYGYALREHGPERVLEHVGVEPTGEAFNSIILDEVHNRPFNPMVNAGAIAIAELTPGDTIETREQNMLDIFSSIAGRPLSIDEKVFQSESDTGHRNRAIAYMMLNTGMIQSDPEEVLRLYFRQCSILVTCEDMAMMAATLANNGVNPRTGETVFQPEQVRDILTLMNTCGMYNYAGQWAFDVGIPAKSGVSGGIVAVIPGQAAVAVYSPPLDPHGNSIRGVEVCKAISSEFSLHAFSNPATVRTIVRREYRLDKVRSKRLRSRAESALLDAEGHRTAVLEVQGPLHFGSAELLIRRMSQLCVECEAVLVDFRRANFADPAAVRLLGDAFELLLGRDLRIETTGMSDHGTLKLLKDEMARLAETAELVITDDIDTALEHQEEQLLRRLTFAMDNTKFALPQIDLFAGMSKVDLKQLESIVAIYQFAEGEYMMRQGDDANAFFVIARGSASVLVPVEDGQMLRVAGVGPGSSVGEMALIDGGKRSAHVVADEVVICYAFSVDRIREAADSHPALLTTILQNLVASLTDRLRQANDVIREMS